MDYTINRVFDHYEVLDSFGQFLFSADNMNEIVEELAQRDAA